LLKEISDEGGEGYLQRAENGTRWKNDENMKGGKRHLCDRNI
jgi:hypothetical protein